MIPISLSLKNFLSYKDNAQVLNLEGIHLACLCGANGNGKSALLDAMTWAAWGRARGQRQDELIHYGQREMQVELVAQIGNQRYRIIRKYLKNKSSSGITDLQLQLFSGNAYKSISGNTISETQQNIINLFGMDYSTFVNSVYLVQGKSDNFNISTPKERKDVLGKILNLTYYDNLVERAKKKSRSLQSELDYTRKDLESLQANIQELIEYQDLLTRVEHSLTQINSEIKNQQNLISSLKEQEIAIRQKDADLIRIQGILTRKIESLATAETALNENKTQLTKYQNLSQKLPVLKSKIDGIRLVLKEGENHNRHIEKLRASQQKLTNDLHLLSVSNKNLGQEGNNLRTKINLFSDLQTEPHCPLCSTALTQSGLQSLVSSYRTQIKEKAKLYNENEAATKCTQQRQTSLKRELDDLVRQQKTQRDINQNLLIKLEGEYKDASSAQCSQEKLKIVIADRSNKIANSMSEITSLKKEVASLEMTTASLAEITSEIKSAESLYNSSLERRGQLLGKQSLLEEKLKPGEELTQRMASKELSLAKITEGAQAYGDLAIAFGKGGIQALLIESSIPLIEQEANKLLSRMTDNRMSLTLETLKEKRSSKENEQIETLEVYIADELGTRSYEMYSGGESFRINLALRIALSKLIAWRSGSPLPTLFIDEGFGTQDISGQEKIIEAINAIQQDFQCIIVITHIDEIKEAFPVRIEVSKNELGSVFSIT